MNKKGLITLLVIFVLVVAGAVWYYEAQMQGGYSTPTTTGSTTTGTTTGASSTISYVNNQYGFNVVLPASWQGYTIVTSTWSGVNMPSMTGPIISIRNPAWTSSTPTQDIPVMVFATSEWSMVVSGEMPVGAAPIPPSELGANAKYVFALPARYNYAYPQGWQEVETILQGNPLHAF
jgi:hypothetical protein